MEWDGRGDLYNIRDRGILGSRWPSLLSILKGKLRTITGK